MSSPRSLVLSDSSSDWSSELQASPIHDKNTRRQRRPSQSSHSLKSKGGAKTRAEIIRQKYAESQGIRRQLRGYRRSNSNASCDSAEQIVHKDAQAVSESLKAMEGFMNAVNSKHRRRKLLGSQQPAELASHH
ncbi:expressed unknown protein [Seminavis robusta]|uniref:Uncharacterized protein n=1 Tax=Seminavis robusta TaxID=568900 RepID=A0A9N8DGV0_9STRA|nr:expressed unknown protein [Seminavis robusta]|eukprot:Sro145_g067310.1 n/a (133) ;mRNA; r:53156-53554